MSKFQPVLDGKPVTIFDKVPKQNTVKFTQNTSMELVVLPDICHRFREVGNVDFEVATKHSTSKIPALATIIMFIFSPLMWMGVWPACIPVCHPHAWWLWRPENGFDFPGIGVTNGCEIPSGTRTRVSQKSSQCS